MVDSDLSHTKIVVFYGAGAVLDESLVDCVELVVPEPPRRHVYNKDYREGTLREKLFGLGPRLPNEHPGATYRLAGLATTLLA